VNGTGTLPPPTVRLPDGVYALGCSPLFHYIATEDSARLPPLMANAFQVGVPQAFLEDGAIRDAAVHRDANQQKMWTKGSMLMLFTAGAFIESHLSKSTGSIESGWLKQDHASIFPLACCFRLILGLEYLGLWQRHFQTQVKLEDFLPFLAGSWSANRDVKVHIDMSAEKGAKPLLIAPWILPPKPANPSFDPSSVSDWDRAYHPGCEAVSLLEFALWVSSLPPGRVVYSSHRSDTGDIYLRLDDAVIVLAFCCPTSSQGPLSPQTVFEMYEDAVGDPEWWQVSMVSYILMPCTIGAKLEDYMDNSPCAMFEALQAVEGCRAGNGIVREKSELIICNPKMLSSFLGPLRVPIFSTVKMFDREIAENQEEQKNMSDIWNEKYEAEEEERIAREAKEPSPSQSPAKSPDSPRSAKSVGGLCQWGDNASPQQEEIPKRQVAESMPNLPTITAAMFLPERKEGQGSKAKRFESISKRGDDARHQAKRFTQRGTVTEIAAAKRSIAQGAAGNAVEWRSKRAGKPKTQQLLQNMEALSGLLSYINEHSQKLIGLVMPPIRGESASTSRSQLTSQGTQPLAAPTPFPVVGGGYSAPAGSAAVDVGLQGSQAAAAGDDDSWNASEEDEEIGEADRGRSPTRREDQEDHDVECEVRIERGPSPQRSEKTRLWRAPTPFEFRDHHAAVGEFGENPNLPITPPDGSRKGKAPRRPRGCMGLEMFDFCGLGNWKAELGDPNVKSGMKIKRLASQRTVMMTPTNMPS